MIEKFKTLKREKPLILLIFIALFFRLIAAFFSQGYGMHDDHFLVIEASQSWADGEDYNNWLPWNQEGEKKPEGHSFFYVGIHYILFETMNIFELSPKTKMLIIRILHALLSLIVVSFGYKISEKISDKETAWKTGLLLSIAWFMPFLSVRNLVEIVAIPPLIVACLIIMRAEEKENVMKAYLYAGLLMGVAFSIRFQTILFTGGVGLAVLLGGRWKEMLVTAGGVLISIILVQGGIDLFVWGYPFAELKEYVLYNIENRNNYLTGSPFMYIGVLTGLFLIPSGIYFLIGFFRMWRKELLLFLPSFIFLAFHSYFPNKQERFIFTIIPFFLILGVAGWENLRKKDKFKGKAVKLYKAGNILFWTLNTVLLVVFTTTYSKRARVETMTYLSDYKINGYLVEETNAGKLFMMPQFYSKQWVERYSLSNSDEINEEIYNENPEDLAERYKRHFQSISDEKHSIAEVKENIDFVLFVDSINLKKRVANMKSIYPGLTFDKKILPSKIDAIIHRLNPINKNQPVFIYRTQKEIPNL